MRSFAALLGVGVVLLITSGCGPSDGIPTYPVTGTVTFAGQPVEVGTIVFDPVDQVSPSAMGGIQDGQITANVPAGEMIIRITAVRLLDIRDQYGERITESYIPGQYNKKSKLRETVSPDAENHFVFDLNK